MQGSAGQYCGTPSWIPARLNCWNTIPIFSSPRPKFRLLQCGKLLSTDSDLSAVRRLKTVYQADQCGLSGSGKPYDTADITLFSTWILTSSNAWTVPYFPEKVLLTCSIWINVSSSPSEKRDFRTSQVFAVSVILRVNNKPGSSYTSGRIFLALTGNYFLYTGTWLHNKAPGRKKRPEIHIQQQQHILFMLFLPAFPIPVSPFQPPAILQSNVSSSSELPVRIRWRYNNPYFLVCQYDFIYFKSYI